MRSTIFHFTHYKAGSQWISEILFQATLRAKNFHRLHPIELLKQEIQPNSVYSPAYLTKQEFQVWTGENTFDDVKNEITPFERSKILDRIPPGVSNFNKKLLSQPEKIKLHKFFVIRDLRDSTISAYFSVKYSHVETDQITKKRRILEGLSKEDGIFYMIEEYIDLFARIQRSWIDYPDISIFRYEDFIDNEFKNFWELNQYCEIDITDKDLREIVNNNSFSNRTGRKPGEEDKHSHLRSGTKNNWKSHFTDGHIKKFKELYGDTLIKTRYEKDNNW
jgi:lipopolysaccharide transport system ATP-binding protein